MILDTIAASAKERVAVAKEALPLAEQIARARESDCNTGFPFEQALAKKRMSFICEVKKASPSKGLIAPEFPYVQIAKEYEAAGADAISVLTESAYFQGKNEYLTKIRQTVQIPLLRKDFTVDEYMIYEAKNIGADAVLLICVRFSLPCSCRNTRGLQENLACRHWWKLMTREKSRWRLQQMQGSSVSITGI